MSNDMIFSFNENKIINFVEVGRIIMIIKN